MHVIKQFTRQTPDTFVIGGYALVNCVKGYAGNTSPFIEVYSRDPKLLFAEVASFFRERLSQSYLLTGLSRRGVVKTVSRA
jgi:hypothetical protein